MANESTNHNTHNETPNKNPICKNSLNFGLLNTPPFVHHARERASHWDLDLCVSSCELVLIYILYNKPVIISVVLFKFSVLPDQY